MTYYLNRDERYTGAPPSDEFVIGAPFYGEVEPALSGGLYYRQDSESILGVEQIIEGFRLDPAASTLRGFQHWVDNGWKTPHASFASVERMGDKLYEEHKEFRDEVLEYFEADKPTNSKELISEAGDVLWCVVALANNAGADLEESVRNELFQYLLGVTYMEKGKQIKPKWHDTVASTASKYEPVTLGDIIDVYKSGFEPLPSVVMNIYDHDEPNESAAEHVMTLLMLCASLRNQTESQYMWGGDMNMVTLYSEFKRRAGDIGSLAAQAVLQVGYILHIAGTGIDVAMSQNVSKLVSRIESGLIDKSDGARPDGLQ